MIEIIKALKKLNIIPQYFILAYTVKNLKYYTVRKMCIFNITPAKCWSFRH